MSRRPLPSGQGEDRLNTGQGQRVSTTLAHVDELLGEVLRNLAGAQEAGAFPRYLADATPIQRQVMQDYVAQVRAAMRAVLEQLGLAPPPARTGAVWASRTTLRMAAIAIEELGPKYLRGYGALSPEAARTVNGAVTRLLDLLDQMEAFLAQGAGRELEARLRRLDGTRADHRLVAELARIVTVHGLVELRAAVELALERLESDALEVAAFGRVSCGKSSLLNRLLGAGVLPVGVTPITAVPARIGYGAVPRGSVSFATAAPEVFELGRLAEFATEHQNPANARHVTRLHVELPASILRDGVVLIDTPGLGSLVAGAEEAARACLPRCDVGIVLVDAAATLAPEDTAVVDALLRAGAHVMVLLSKADLLSADDRVRASTYVWRRLLEATGTEVPVFPVSVKGGATALFERWVETGLRPCLEDRRRLAERSLRRKVGALRDDVIAALERLCVRPSASVPAGASAAESILSEALADLDALRTEPFRAIPDVARTAAELLAEATHNAAVLWKRGFTRTSDVAELLGASLRSRAGLATQAAVRDVMKARAVLANALAGAAELTATEGEDDLPRPSAAPTLGEAGIVPAATVVERSALTPPVAWLLSRRIRRQLARAGVDARIAAAVAAHDRRVTEWRAQWLAALRREFVARSGGLRSRLGSGAEAPPGASRAALADARRDLERLRGREDRKGVRA